MTLPRFTRGISENIESQRELSENHESKRETSESQDDRIKKPRCPLVFTLAFMMLA